MKQRVQTPYGEARVHRVTPTGAHERVVVVPGFSESLSHNRELVDMLANKGYDAFTFSQPRKTGNKVGNVLDRERDILLSVLAAMLPADEKVYVVAHSLGSAVALTAATDTPGRFLGLILMQPPGLTAKQNLAELLKRVGKKTIRNTLYIVHARHLRKFR